MWVHSTYMSLKMYPFPGTLTIASMLQYTAAATHNIVMAITKLNLEDASDPQDLLLDRNYPAVGFELFYTEEAAAHYLHEHIQGTPELHPRSVRHNDILYCFATDAIRDTVMVQYHEE